MKLKICESYTRDVGRGVIRIDYDTMDELKLSTGDIVELAGKRKCYAKALPLYPSDEGKKRITMDAITRKNLDVMTGFKIEIKKIKCKPAIMVSVKYNDFKHPLDPRYLNSALESVPIVKGDTLAVPYFGGKLSIDVLRTNPPGPVLITQQTSFVPDNDDKLRVCPTCGSKLGWK